MPERKQVSGWGGFWIAAAIAITFGFGWFARIDCGWLGIEAACKQVAETYVEKPATKPRNPNKH
jgi:hypothetical protein